MSTISFNEIERFGNDFLKAEDKQDQPALPYSFTPNGVVFIGNMLNEDSDVLNAGNNSNQYLTIEEAPDNIKNENQAEVGIGLTKDEFGGSEDKNNIYSIGMNPEPAGGRSRDNLYNLEPATGFGRECPTSPPVGDGNWVEYGWSTVFFHCGYDCYLEGREPTPDNPRQECCYDEEGNLVDKNHKYSGCRGTADQYPKGDVLKHMFLDSGGVLSHGLEAYLETIRHKGDKDMERIGKEIRKQQAVIEEQNQKIEYLERKEENTKIDNLLNYH